jgi:hypothetical protein
MEYGLHRCQTNYLVFPLCIDEGYIMFLIYLDDIVITGNDLKALID